MITQKRLNTQLSRQIAEMAQMDQPLSVAIFADLFSSVWNQMEKSPKNTMIFEYFVQSGQLSTSNLPLTPLHAFFAATRKFRTPINMDSLLLENISVEHGGWFESLEELERQCRYDKQLTHEKYSDNLKRVDSLLSVYSQLGEDDLKIIWKRRANLKATSRAIQLYGQVSGFGERLIVKSAETFM